MRWSPHGLHSPQDPARRGRGRVARGSCPGGPTAPPVPRPPHPRSRKPLPNLAKGVRKVVIESLSAPNLTILRPVLVSQAVVPSRVPRVTQRDSWTGLGKITPRHDQPQSNCQLTGFATMATQSQRRRLPQPECLLLLLQQRWSKNVLRQRRSGNLP